MALANAVTHGGAEKAAWLFYSICATGSLAGQIWVGAEKPPWPDTIPLWTRIVIMFPFAAVIDLGGVISSAFADLRRQLGEPALEWRILSGFCVTLAVGINIAGHWRQPYLTALFGGLGVLAYAVWLAHSAARRRDTLRAQGLLARTAPHYGLGQWLRQPALTRRAKTLALTCSLPLYESLTTAAQQLRNEQRQHALAAHIEQLIRQRHHNPVLASIAVTTLDMDAIAAALTAQSDVDGWAALIGENLTPPATPGHHEPAPPQVQPPSDGTAAAVTAALAVLPKGLLRRVPENAEDYSRWRDIWHELRLSPDEKATDLAARHDISDRQVRWIRSVGATGLLDDPRPPLQRIAEMAQRNGHPFTRTP